MSASPEHLYEEDFVRWTEQQAAALREAASAVVTNLPLDWENLAEEIDDLGRSVRRELNNRLLVVLEHLLKLEHSPATDPRRGWIETIGRERVIIEDLLAENPSLKSVLSQTIERAKRRSARLAALSLSRFGESAAIPEPSYTEEQVLGDWLPGDAPPPADGERV